MQREGSLQTCSLLNFTKLDPHQQGYILLPSSGSAPGEKVAMLHAIDIRFGPVPGAGNVLCAGGNTSDLRNAYDVRFEQTSDVGTFMQVRK